MVLILATLLLPTQDPVSIQKFAQIIDKAEKAGLAAPDLADAGKWDAAAKELGKTIHPHPLVVAIRARVKAAFLARAEKARKDRRFDEALDALKTGSETHPDDADVKSLREAMFKELVDLGK